MTSLSSSLSSLSYHIIITGASRGFGSSIALSMVRAIDVNSRITFTLSGRSSSRKELDDVKNKILLNRNHSNSDDITKVLIVEADLHGDVSKETISSNLFNDIDVNNTHTIFINNAGSLGPLTTLDSIVSSSSPSPSNEIYNQMNSAFNLNVTMCCFLSSEFSRKVKELGKGCCCGTSSKFTIVNVSSLAAVQAFETWGIYCAGKAAREMFHKVLALEQSKNKIKVKILNYAPGPLDTDMQKEIRECSTVDEETRKYFVSLKEESKLVDPNQSAAKLMKIVLNSNYENGAHIDFFDPEGPELAPVPPVNVTSPCSCSCGSNCQCVDCSCSKKKLCPCDDCTCGVDCRCALKDPAYKKCKECEEFSAKK